MGYYFFVLWEKVIKQSFKSDTEIHTILSNEVEISKKTKYMISLKELPNTYFKEKETYKCISIHSRIDLKNQ